jgi:hypothetical protein
MGRKCSTQGRKVGRMKGLVGKPDGMRPFGRPRRLCDLREIGWGCYGLDASDSFEHCNGISGSINFGKFLSCCATVGFSRRNRLHGVS